MTSGGRKTAALTALALALCALASAAPASATTATFSKCTSTNIPVIDFGTQGLGAFVRLPKNAAHGQLGTVTRVTAGVQVSHTRDSDLSLSLVSPSGRAIALAVRRGVDGDGYGAAPSGCGGSLVQFDDDAATPIATPGNTLSNPILGGFRPEQPLSTFNGAPVAGSWMLVMSDRSAGEIGAITAYDLHVTYTYKKKAKKKPKK